MMTRPPFVHTLQTWPDPSWVPLPRGYRWITLAQAPVPYINLRAMSADGSSVRIPAGIPIPLDPDTDYEIQNQADPLVDLVTLPGPTVATLSWLLRKTTIVLSDHPVPVHPVVAFAYKVAKIQAAAVTLQMVRFTTRKWVSLFAQSAGIITFAGLYPFDPEIEAVAGVAGAGIATNGAVKAIGAAQNVDVVLHKDPAAEGTANRWSARGAIDYVAFAVTTTPTIYMSVAQEEQ